MSGPVDLTTSAFSEPREPVRRHALLDLDADLGRLLSPERRAAARAEVRARVVHRRVGPWSLDEVVAGSSGYLWLLVVDGVVARDVTLEDVISTELLGAGDVIRPGASDEAERLVADEASWTVLAPCRIAVIDGRCAIALASYPEISTVLLERVDRRAQRLARAQAIVALNRVERRVLAMLWLLAERWGRITADGVLLPLDISHRLLGQLVGARRPTISTAAGDLARQGLVQRREDGAWVLLGAPSGLPSDGVERLFSKRRLRVDERSPSGSF